MSQIFLNSFIILDKTNNALLFLSSVWFNLKAYYEMM